MIFIVFLYIGFVFYLYIGWNHKKKQNNSGLNASEPLVTVLLPMRNEADKVLNTLKSLSLQKYRNFELIVIDDFSIDNSLELVLSYAQTSQFRYKIIELKDKYDATYLNSNNKKRAITEGVNASEGALIISIDADITMKDLWLGSMVNYYLHTDMVFFSGPVLYPKQEGFFGKFLEVDQINNMAITEATINWGIPVLANGANMAFKKSAWDAVNGYEYILDIPSGDDIMLLHRMKSKFPQSIGFNNQEAAIVYTNPVNDFSSFLHQRVRWFSKSLKYEQKSSMIFLAMGLLFNMYIIAQLFLWPYHILYSLFVLIIKAFAETMFLTPPLYYYKRQEYFIYLPIFAILFSVYITGIALITPWMKYKWK